MSVIEILERIAGDLKIFTEKKENAFTFRADRVEDHPEYSGFGWEIIAKVERGIYIGFENVPEYGKQFNDCFLFLELGKDCKFWFEGLLTGIDELELYYQDTLIAAHKGHGASSQRFGFTYSLIEDKIELK